MERAVERMNTNRIPFLNTYIDSLTAAEAKYIVDQLIHKPGYHYVVTPNSDIIVKMQDDKELKDICEKADLILTDGQIVVNLSQRTGYPIKERIAMTDFVWDVLDLADEKGYRVFLFGGKENVLRKATKRIQHLYPKLNIIGSYSPPYGFENDEEQLSFCINRIKKSKADILIVFLGCPKQEKFIANNKDKYCVPISITMGGCVDFIAGGVRRAPQWMQNIGLEWFFRFLQEPKRLFARYFIEDIRIFGLARKYREIEKKRKRVL